MDSNGFSSNLTTKQLYHHVFLKYYFIKFEKSAHDAFIGYINSLGHIHSHILMIASLIELKLISLNMHFNLILAPAKLETIYPYFSHIEYLNTICTVMKVLHHRFRYIYITYIHMHIDIRVHFPDRKTIWKWQQSLISLNTKYPRLLNKWNVIPIKSTHLHTIYIIFNISI